MSAKQKFPGTAVIKWLATEDGKVTRLRERRERWFRIATVREMLESLLDEIEEDGIEADHVMCIYVGCRPPEEYFARTPNELKAIRDKPDVDDEGT